MGIHGATELLSKRSFQQRVAAIAKAAALGLVSSTPMAAIIDSGPISYAVPQTSAGLYINLVTNAVSPNPALVSGWDFNPFGSINLGFFASTSSFDVAAVVATGGIATALSVGDTIGPGNSYQVNGASLTTGTAFRNTGTAYVGISFTNEVTSATNYGYAQVQTTATTGYPAKVLRYVYENTGLPITIAAPPATILYGYNLANNHLVSFDATLPNILLTDIPLTGLAVSETLLGIDFRPANGLLYGTAGNGTVERVVTIDTTTGAVAPVNTANTLAQPPGTAFGVDFNPVVDRLRQVSDGDSSVRLSPSTGALVGMDTTLAYAAGDPNAGVNPNVVHVAYTNNAPGATLSTLYGIDSSTDSLVIIGGPNGSPSPNTGQLTTIGPLGVDTQAMGGFDIHFGANVAYAALRVGGVSTMYTINLATGAATAVGAIGSGTQIDGLSVAFSSAPKLLIAQSRKVQGAAGTFGLTLANAIANPTTEPRLGPTHTIVLTFGSAINGITVTVVEGLASLGAITFSGNDVIVPLSGVTDGQYVTLAITNVSDFSGNVGGGGNVRIGFLAGDVNQSRVVSIADLGLVNAQLAQPVTAANFLKDVNATGTLTVADKGITNANLTHALPAP
jgi:Domain of unknown function (DUF4394)